MAAKRFTIDGNWIKDNWIDKLLNINFNTINDAMLCCDLLNNAEDKKLENGKLATQLLKENEQLKEENEFAKLLANHRGEMVSFANSLIQDVDDELAQKMWYQFKEEMYQKWKKKKRS